VTVIKRLFQATLAAAAFAAGTTSFAQMPETLELRYQGWASKVLYPEQQTRHRSRILQRGARDLGRIEDARYDQIAIFAGCRVVAETGFSAALSGITMPDAVRAS
jgi:hypothetical protein